MQHVSIAKVETEMSDGGADRYRLGDSLNAAGVAVNRYVLAPGERISGLHAHLDQEEVFVVLNGVLTFETWTPDESSDGTDERATPGGAVTVDSGEAIRFAPGDFQSGRNDGDEEAAVLALGAPRDGEGVRIPLPCPGCGHEDRRPGMDGDGQQPVLVCPNCGTERDATCPTCGSKAMYATLSDDDRTPIGVCRDCGAVSRA